MIGAGTSLLIASLDMPHAQLRMSENKLKFLVMLGIVMDTLSKLYWGFNFRTVLRILSVVYVAEPQLLVTMFRKVVLIQRYP